MIKMFKILGIKTFSIMLSATRRIEWASFLKNLLK